MSQHEWDGAIESHLTVKLILEYIKVIESVWFTSTAHIKRKKKDSFKKRNHIPFSYLVVLRARESACSGMP